MQAKALDIPFSSLSQDISFKIRAVLTMLLALSTTSANTFESLISYFSSVLTTSWARCSPEILVIYY